MCICGFTNMYKCLYCLSRKNRETIIRMDTMEIDDDTYIDKSLTMEGLITQGTVST